MRTIIITALIIIGLASFFLLLPTPHSKEETPALTIIRGAEVFDGEQWLGQQDVAFKEGFITQVANNLSNQYKQAHVIDGRGQYLIPGLIDAHTHAWDNALSKAVKFGVTTELDMFTNNAFAVSQRERRARHNENVQLADLFSAGTLITAPNGHGTEYGLTIDTINNASQAAQFVAARIAEGSDYIKIVYDAQQRHMPSIDLNTLTAVINASHEQGKLAVVHINDLVSAQHAIDAGADGLVHAFMDQKSMGNESVKQLGQIMAQQQQFIIPTLSILASMTGQDRSAPLIADFSDKPKFGASALTSQLSSIRTDRNNNTAFAQAQQNVGDLAKAGVIILAGTDAPNPGTAHGISLHGELELLVESGLSNNEALKAATSNVATVFSLPQRGYIKPTMKADLILLAKDPAENITHTRSIIDVFKNGYAIDYDKQRTANTLDNSILLGNFNDNMTSSLATTWQPTTDKRFGGASTVTLDLDNAHDRQYLHLTGSVKTKFSYPWAGAFLPLSESNQVAFDLNNMANVSFSSRGTKGAYKLMLFSLNQPMRPLEIKFNVTDAWQPHQLALDSVSPDLLSAITGLAIVANTPSSEFELMIDDVWLNQD